jgi:hypothetical protein
VLAASHCPDWSGICLPSILVGGLPTSWANAADATGSIGRSHIEPDTDNTLWHQPESAGLNAVAEGFRHLGFKDDHEINAAEWLVYDALYAYCQEMVRRGMRDGVFKND